MLSVIGNAVETSAANVAGKAIESAAEDAVKNPLGLVEKFQNLKDLVYSVFSEDSVTELVRRRVDRTFRFFDAVDQALQVHNFPYRVDRVGVLSDKFKVQLIESVSLEDQPDIRALWQNLLISAMEHPETASSNGGYFGTLITQLNPLDVHVLKLMYQIHGNPNTRDFPPAAYGYESPCYYRGKDEATFKDILKVDWPYVELSLNKLLGLRLIDNTHSIDVPKTDSWGRLDLDSVTIDAGDLSGRDNSEIRVNKEQALQSASPFLTPLGISFIQACVEEAPGPVAS